MELDTSKWSGEGAFTQVLIDCLKQIDEVVFVRVEDAPASRSDADYNFISNEIFVGFASTSRLERTWRFGILPQKSVAIDKSMTVQGLERALVKLPEVGAADYSDEAMLQYLRTERIIPPYQTRGYKIVELVRIYEAGVRREAANA